MSLYTERFRVGERVELLPEHQTGSWKGYAVGVILGPVDGEGHGSSLVKEERKGDSWKVRWEEYTYSSEADFHYGHDSVLKSIEPDALELNEALASIGQAARKILK